MLSCHPIVEDGTVSRKRWTSPSSMSDSDSENGGALAPAPAREPSIEVQLPPLKPPQTIAPVQFNQQVNLSIQQIPTSAWDKLSSEQILVSGQIIAQVDAADKRQFVYAMEKSRSSSGKRMAIICGSVVTAVGYSISGYLASHGQSMVAAHLTSNYDGASRTRWQSVLRSLVRRRSVQFQNRPLPRDLNPCYRRERAMS